MIKPDSISPFCALRKVEMAIDWSWVWKLLKVWDSGFGEINKVGYGRQKTNIRQGKLSTSAHTKTALLHEQCSGQWPTEEGTYCFRMTYELNKNEKMKRTRLCFDANASTLASHIPSLLGRKSTFHLFPTSTNIIITQLYLSGPEYQSKPPIISRYC